MNRRSRWTLGLLVALGAAATALTLAFFHLMPDEGLLAQHIRERAEARLGVPVTLGAVRWQLLPPALVVEDAATVQEDPIRIKRLVARPALRDLLQRRIRLTHLQVDGALLPQLSIAGLRRQAPPTRAVAVPLEQLQFTNLTWRSRHGNALSFDGDLLFDGGWRPRTAALRATGTPAGLQARLTREGDADRWQVDVRVGGGTTEGWITLEPRPGGALRLAGELESRDVEVGDALAALRRSSAVRGRAAGRTTLSAEGLSGGELVRSLRTLTRFRIAPATVLHLDIDKAIRSAGLDRDGQTTLRSVTGQMDTRNTPQGMEMRWSAVQAEGETFTARGSGTVIDRRVKAQLDVDLAGGLVGVPLQVDGPLAAPQVTVPRSAMAGAAAGAAVGTAMLPGVGTAVGAKVGAALGKALGGGDAPRATPAPVERR